VELVAYQLKGVVTVWYDQWKKSRVEGAPIVRWVVFEEAFVGRFIPPCAEREKGKRIPHS